MVRRPPKSKRTDTLFPYTTLFRSTSVGSSSPRTSGRNAPPESPVEPFFLQCIRGFGASYHGSSLLVLAPGGGTGYSSAPYKRRSVDSPCTRQQRTFIAKLFDDKSTQTCTRFDETAQISAYR